MIIIKLNFLLSFKPLFFRVLKKNQTQIFCKWFFFILLFFEYYFTNFTFIYLLNKKKKRINSFLKAPHHYKIAQTKIVRVFFFLKLFFKIILKVYFKAILNYVNILNLNFFSSSIIYLTNLHFYFYIRNFLLI